jgi:hypothetical protein
LKKKSLPQEKDEVKPLGEGTRGNSSGRLVAKMNGEYLMLVSKNGDGLWAIICALSCISVGWGVKFHTFPLPE